MRVILRKEVEALGDVGDVVEVADGYGMNHLIPKGFAIHATANSVRTAQHEQLLREAQIQVAKRGSEKEAEKFSGSEVEFTVLAGEDGRLFGSVTNRDIEAALAEKGIEVSRKKILLEEPIRRVGEFKVAIRLHPEVRAAVKVLVLADEASPEDNKSAGREAPEGDGEEADVSSADKVRKEQPVAAECAQSPDGAEVLPGEE